MDKGGQLFGHAQWKSLFKMLEKGGDSGAEQSLRWIERPWRDLGAVHVAPMNKGARSRLCNAPALLAPR
jgi:hypothetical protein